MTEGTVEDPTEGAAEKKPRRRTRKHRTTDPLLRIVQSIREETSELLDGQTQSGVPTAFETPHGAQITAWVHTPEKQVRPDVLLELHGGGFALGDARKEDALLEWAATRYGMRTVGLDYRLAPEHPFPAAYDDVVDTLAALASGSLLGEPAGGIHILGYSAGAQLALSAAALGGTPVASLLLYYPFVDATTVPAREDARDMDLPYDLMEAFNRWYAGENDPHDSRISASELTDADLARLPRTMMFPVVGDALTESSKRLAARMLKAGCEVRWNPIEGTYHGYVEDMVNGDVYTALNPPDLFEARGSSSPDVAYESLMTGFTWLFGGGCADELPLFVRHALD